ncbi:trans-2-enoyl-CoA reductase [Novosphingobium endophyticum]|uniref:enoyl-[acyl-carrier-protein] reductase n=1 Tax=Novosphingobium endophyticum TaxID=1955250 RepID=A0A916TSL5_9SPHN|nr:2-enoyl thioester reductase domain-containing protein [Novosphingobium endophyticum]GGC03306.1 trans-2-enoyl-CoA reductase [Novosphingobium endophyticum]
MSDNLAVLPGSGGRVRLVEMPRPAPLSDRDVLVRMLYAPINPADLLAIDGRYAFDLGSAVPLGAEGVGRVEEVGAAVSDLRPGDRVLPLTRGNWASYRVLDREQLIAVPAGIPDEQAAMLRINPPTARLLLDNAGAGDGAAIVQNAAGSTVAAWVRALAARRAIHVVDVVRNADAALPHAVVDGPALAASVSDAAAGRAVRAALDCVAGEATGRLAECVSAGGRIVVFGHLSGQPVAVRSQLLTGGGLSISGFSLRPAETALGADGVNRMFAELFDLFLEAPPSLATRALMPLREADRAVVAAREGGKGRILLDLTA